MGKRTSYEIKKEILKILSDNKEHSYADLERKVNTNWESIRNQCKELYMFEFVEIKESKVFITNRGKEIFKKLEKTD